ncbi:hypothetical protein [Alcanivorax sp.]|uniref:hypothetical protein n=1 Tax=Alcanivorax sp. TaxID=1872427 RepID=UPI0025BA1547|nr:hypothetical protein [Alcanivorax sp.]
MTTLGLAPKEESIQIHAVSTGDDIHQALLAVPAESDWKAEMVFLQAPGWWRPRRQLTLFNGRYLEWRERKGRSDSARVINLAFVKPEPILQRTLAWCSITVMALAALVTGLSVHAAWLPGMIGGALLVLLSGLNSLRCSSASFQFVTRHGGAPVFALYRQRGDRERVEKVLKAIGVRGQKAWTLLPKGKARLAAEVAEHRRLADSGCLSRDTYEAAKQRIFSRYAKGAAVRPASG